MKKEWLVAFHSTHHAIAAERLAKEQEWNMEMIPTPRDISASCGLSLRCTEPELVTADKVIEKFNEKKVLWAGVYIASGLKGRQKTWELIRLEKEEDNL